MGLNLRAGILVLAFWAAAGLAPGQAPYPGSGPMVPQVGYAPNYPPGGMMPYSPSYSGYGSAYQQNWYSPAYPPGGTMPYSSAGYSGYGSAYPPGGYTPSYPPAGLMPYYPNYGGYQPAYPQSGYVPAYPPGGVSYSPGGYPYLQPYAYPWPPNPYPVNGSQMSAYAPNMFAGPPYPVANQDSVKGDLPAPETKPDSSPAPETKPDNPDLAVPNPSEMKKDFEDLLPPTKGETRPRFWASAEYVSWWVQGSSLPPLVTTSPAGTPQTSAGVLGASGTTTLFGNEFVNGDMRPGGRFVVGGWFNDAGTCGIEAGLMVIGGDATHYSSSSGQIIARPFIDATTGQEVSQIIAFPGLANGNVAANASSDPLIIADLALRTNLCCNCFCGWATRVDFLVGYRYVHFAEGLQIQENLTSTDPLTQGTNISVNDSFITRNDFNGGLLGLEAEFVRGPFSLLAFGKLALGNMHNEVIISGNTVISAPGAAPISYPGGLLALSSNSGVYSANHFAFLPEIGLTAGYQVNRWLRLTVGYSFLYLTEVVRPANQIDPTVNPNLLPPAIPSSTPLRPSFTFQESDLWIQGIRLGLEVRF
jgi:hypothetical protein